MLDIWGLGLKVCVMCYGNYSRGDHATGRETVCGVEKTDTERPAIGPTGLGLERGENPFTGATTFLRDNENGNQDSGNTDQSPEDSKSLKKNKR